MINESLSRDTFLGLGLKCADYRFFRQIREGFCLSEAVYVTKWWNITCFALIVSNNVLTILENRKN